MNMYIKTAKGLINLGMVVSIEIVNCEPHYQVRAYTGTGSGDYELLLTGSFEQCDSFIDSLYKRLYAADMTL